MPGASHVFTGDVFNHWTVISDPFKKSYQRGSVWSVKVKCSCGTVGLVSEYGLKTGKTRSCKLCADSRLVSVRTIPGEKHGCWMVVGEEPKSGKYRQVKIRCACGHEAVVAAGNIKACNPNGCKNCLPKKIKHGMAGSPEYNTYHGMVSRCTDPLDPAYANYGGRGVTICDRWNPHKGGSFENFLEDVGLRPGPGYALDKEAVDPLNTTYSPGLVEWVTRSENNGRRRNSIWIEFNGRSRPLSDVARELDVKNDLLRYMIRKKGLSPSEAIAFLQSIKALKTNHSN